MRQWRASVVSVLALKGDEESQQKDSGQQANEGVEDPFVDVRQVAVRFFGQSQVLSQDISQLVFFLPAVLLRPLQDV
jgi:hypothetical protein